MSILTLLRTEKERFIDHCIQCGVCAESCPILPYTDIRQADPQEIQEKVYDCIDDGTFNHLAYTKAFACMECFKCTKNTCPLDLNPMMINEMIKEQYLSKGKTPSPFRDQKSPESTHRIVSRIQVSEQEYKRITTPTQKQTVDYLFFPGCNVYFQPEKILSSLDILDASGDLYGFLPGLDYCCSDNHLFFGHPEQAGSTADELMTAISRYQPKTLVLWCPTCLCRFDQYISPSMNMPFNVLSFPQYLATIMHRLSLTDTESRTVTLHDPCKSVYTGVDLDGPRKVLSQLPGVTLKEMEHHGRNTMCCGSGAVCWFPDSCDQIENHRLEEARKTMADHLVTVCHYCSQTFSYKEQDYPFDVVNYISLVAASMGIYREDKFKKYVQWNDLDLILNDIGDRMDNLSIKKDKIIETLKTVFIR